MTESFSEKVKSLIKRVPKGKVATYGQIAAMAGSPRAARQIVRILHSCSRNDNLPWHRIVNRLGRISLKQNHGYELQKALLEDENIVFEDDDSVDFDRYLWSPV